MRKPKIGRWEVNFHEHFKYDENSPTGLAWARNNPNNKKEESKIGKPAGYNGMGKMEGYYMIGVHGYPYAVHQVVWVLNFGNYDTREMKIDHIDGDRKNNKLSNLRLVTMAVNLRNAGVKSTNRTGITGVSYSNYFSSKLNRVVDVWTAFWLDEHGNRSTARFTSAKHDDPKELAIRAREAAIERLNTLGFGYTENHGKHRGQ